MPKLNISRAHFDYDPEQPEGFRAGTLRLGDTLGAEQTATSVFELSPGEAASPYHYEYGEEEWLLVLEGRPSLRTHEGTEALEPLDIVFFPRGPAGAHQVRNDSDEIALVVMWSRQVYPQATALPDSGKVALWVGDGGEDAIFEQSSAVGFYDGEQTRE